MGAVRVGLAACAVVLVGALPACSGEPAVPTDEAAEQVDMPPSYRFAPETLEVAAGTTVTWTNNDHFTHDVVILEPEETDVGQAKPGETVSFTFDEPGTYSYECSLHPQQMQAVVEVVEATAG